MMYSYNQNNKKSARHLMIRKAVENLTTNRDSSAVVKRSYVRDIYDYFIEEDELSTTKQEVQKIDPKYITEWERLHDTDIGRKRPEELTVCYLCGPEPNNDFQEFVNLGVLPQNIWAFESKLNNYTEALKSYEEGSYPQPRIIKHNLTSFFMNTPQRFDIVYFDACSTLVSTQHSLKCLATMFRYNRLNSIGALITNFSAPDLTKENTELIELISLYLYFKNSSAKIICTDDEKIISQDFLSLKKDVENDFYRYYDTFISAVIRDIGSVIVPVQKIKSNTYFNQLFEPNNQGQEFNYKDLFNKACNNNLAKFVFTSQYLKNKNINTKQLDLFFNELGSLEDICGAFKLLIQIQNGDGKYKDLDNVINFFEGKDIYQFLDNAHKNMFFDIVFNQLTYPMHYNIRSNYRCDYVAKHNHMFMDMTIFDECRYIYEWLPAMHQIQSAFLNKSWQYVFRFALDGLVKSRKEYNNELFFQGAVISDREEKFGVPKISERQKIGGK